jgi:hypothetical protein
MKKPDSFVKLGEPDGDEGTPIVGYMPPENGPFKCENCEHFTPKKGCDDASVKKDLGSKNGFAPVEPEGCCNEFDPKEGD